eukprot:m.363359 g.363359  ORF g.363359 m.363359 type:complete len:399 (-) comp22140_c0_seq1:514-1710(-)
MGEVAVFSGVLVKAPPIASLDSFTFSRWHPRYCELTESALHYYTDDFKTVKKGSIPLESISRIVEVRPHPKHPFAIRLDTPGRTYFFKAASSEDRHDWVTALRGTKRKKRESQRFSRLHEEGVGSEAKRFSYLKLDLASLTGGSTEESADAVSDQTGPETNTETDAPVAVKVGGKGKKSAYTQLDLTQLGGKVNQGSGTQSKDQRSPSHASTSTVSEFGSRAGSAASAQSQTPPRRAATTSTRSTTSARSTVSSAEATPAPMQSKTNPYTSIDFEKTNALLAAMRAGKGVDQVGGSGIDRSSGAQEVEDLSLTSSTSSSQMQSGPMGARMTRHDHPKTSIPQSVQSSFLSSRISRKQSDLLCVLPAKVDKEPESLAVSTQDLIDDIDALLATLGGNHL